MEGPRPQGQEPSPHDRKEQPAESAPAAVDAAGVLRWCIGVLAASAWQALGLIPNPTTNKIERNLDDARLAIDAVAVLAEQLKPRLTDSERRELETLLTDLRVNFVEQKARG